MASATPMLLSKTTQQALLQFHNQCYNLQSSTFDIRTQMLDIDRAYMRETDRTAENLRARVANRLGDANRYQNITVPVVMPQVESAVTYQTSVFLTGIPIFGVAAAPQYEDQAMQMETVIDNNATRGGWVREFQMFFRDGFKYNLGALEVNWAREVTFTPETNISVSTTQGIPKEVVWEGNRVKRWDLYNTVWDTRVAPAEMYKKGEFIANTEFMSRIQLKQFINTLPDKMIDNIKAAFESPSIGVSAGTNSGMPGSFYIPDVNPNAIINAQNVYDFDWMNWAALNPATAQGIQYQNGYQVTTLYARIIPSDFSIKVPSANTPQVWKFIFVNHCTLIYAERQTNAHGYIPVLMGQPQEDGLNYQTKSLAENVRPIQDITSALSNSLIASRRKAVSDKVIFDPSRINSSDINSTNPSAKIPVRPAAYGKVISESVYPFPFRDDQAQVVSQQMAMYGAMANQISGQNPARQGQFVKGNKTQSEYDSVMTNSNGRDQNCSILLEAQVFTPLKEILKIDILQYQGGISLYSRDAQQQVDIDPVALRKSVLSFKVSDGLTPTDKLMDSDTLAVAFQQIGSSPTIGAAYNIGPAFSYLMKIKGADLSPFEKSAQQQTYEQAAQQWQQTVMQMLKMNPEIKSTQFPPQPTPQQFGYDPQAAANSQPQQGQQAPNTRTNSAPQSGVTGAASTPAGSPQQSTPTGQGQQ